MNVAADAAGNSYEQRSAFFLRQNFDLTSKIGMEESWFMASSMAESFPFLVALMLSSALNAALIGFMAV